MTVGSQLQALSFSPQLQQLQALRHHLAPLPSAQVRIGHNLREERQREIKLINVDSFGAFEGLLVAIWSPPASAAHRIETYDIDVVEQLREQLNGQGGIHTTASQQSHRRAKHC